MFQPTVVIILFWWLTLSILGQWEPFRTAAFLFLSWPQKPESFLSFWYNRMFLLVGKITNFSSSRVFIFHNESECNYIVRLKINLFQRLKAYSVLLTKDILINIITGRTGRLSKHFGHFLTGSAIFLLSWNKTVLSPSNKVNWREKEKFNCTEYEMHVN